jgi:hypothetical protein
MNCLVFIVAILETVAALNRLGANYIILNNFCAMVLGLNMFCTLFGVISLVIEMIISDQVL